MRTFTPGNSGETDKPGDTELEGDIRDFVRRDVARLHQSPLSQESELITHGISSVVQRAATTSAQEIDKLIAELQTLREYLCSESERVRREIGGYAHLSQSALASTQVIANAMAQWKAAHENARNSRV